MILSIENLSKSFGAKQILQEIAFTVEVGEILAILGRNGTGKSTLFEVLFGITKADQALIKLDGSILNSTQGVVAYLPQYAFIPVRMRVRTLIQRSISSSEGQDTVFYAPKISKIENRLVGQLSVGERRYLATLLLGQLPQPFLMLDEPFSMLEPIQMEFIKNYLIRLKPSKGILLADHYYEDVLETADRKLLLQEERLQSISSKLDLVKKGYLPQSRL
ncbi:MAG: ATP-binding cassette domain-containing protein [Saprospiraceae bacterium]|nr:ATP-binding cassette domain-containing protein [Saprospiraceae bacterium]